MFVVTVFMKIVAETQVLHMSLEMLLVHASSVFCLVIFVACSLNGGWFDVYVSSHHHRRCQDKTCSRLRNGVSLHNSWKISEVHNTPHNSRFPWPVGHMRMHTVAFCIVPSFNSNAAEKNPLCQLLRWLLFFLLQYLFFGLVKNRWEWLIWSCKQNSVHRNLFAKIFVQIWNMARSNFESPCQEIFLHLKMIRVPLPLRFAILLQQPRKCQTPLTLKLSQLWTNWFLLKLRCCLHGQYKMRPPENEILNNMQAV